MTSIDWLIKELFLEDTIYRYNLKVIEQAKEMHKQEIIDAIEDGRYEFGYEYYNDTFVSKGSDALKDYHIVDTNEMVELPQHPPVFSENGNELLFDKEGKLIKENQQEISDEEIEEEISKRYMHPTQDYAWRDACKWYREQLKQRQ
jgi:hypothetical protein